MKVQIKGYDCHDLICKKGKKMGSKAFRYVLSFISVLLLIIAIFWYFWNYFAIYRSVIGMRAGSKIDVLANPCVATDEFMFKILTH